MSGEQMATGIGFIIVHTKSAKTREVSEEIEKVPAVECSEPVAYCPDDETAGHNLTVTDVVVKVSAKSWDELTDIRISIETNSDVLSSLPLLAINPLEGFSIR